MIRKPHENIKAQVVRDRIKIIISEIEKQCKIYEEKSLDNVGDSDFCLFNFYKTSGTISGLKQSMSIIKKHAGKYYDEK